MYAVQEGIKLAKDVESKGYLMGMMDELDRVSPMQVDLVGPMGNLD